MQKPENMTTLRLVVECQMLQQKKNPTAAERERRSALWKEIKYRQKTNI